jgi:hypothetical protein
MKLQWNENNFHIYMCLLFNLIIYVSTFSNICWHVPFKSLSSRQHIDCKAYQISRTVMCRRLSVSKDHGWNTLGRVWCLQPLIWRSITPREYLHEGPNLLSEIRRWTACDYCRDVVLVCEVRARAPPDATELYWRAASAHSSAQLRGLVRFGALSSALTLCSVQCGRLNSQAWKVFKLPHGEQRSRNTGFE